MFIFSCNRIKNLYIVLNRHRSSYKSDPPSCIYIFYTIKTDGYLDLGGLESICFYYVKCIMKKTFVFYNDRQDYTEEMSLEEKGLFLQVILDYQNWKELWDLWSIKFIRSRVKKQLDQDNMKRSEEIEKRKASWKLWWLAKSKSKQVLASASKWKHHLADNVNDNVNDKYNNIYIPPEIKTFFDKQKENMVTIASQINKDERYIHKQAIEYEKLKKDLVSIWDPETLWPSILEFVYNDSFRKNNIWSITKLRSPNKDKIKYYIVMLEKMKQSYKKTQEHFIPWF